MSMHVQGLAFIYRKTLQEIPSLVVGDGRYSRLQTAFYSFCHVVPSSGPNPSKAIHFGCGNNPRDFGVFTGKLLPLGHVGSAG